MGRKNEPDNRPPKPQRTLKKGDTDQDGNRFLQYAKGYYENGEWWVSAERYDCLLYTHDAADDLLCVDLGGGHKINKNIVYNLYLPCSEEHHTQK